MKTKKRNLIYAIVLMGIILIVISSCKKDKNNDTIIDIDGNIYTSVAIGTQVWMVENLKTTKYNDGTVIPNVTDNTAWANLLTSGYSWYNNDAATYKNTYGALYNWYTVNTGKLCPTGWHVPSDTEWKSLEMFLGMTQAQVDAESLRGTNEGGKLKETGTSHWKTPNTFATNELDFTALPGGARTGGEFFHVGEEGIWWTATLDNTYSAWRRKMRHDYGNINRSSANISAGFSVRCLKN